MGMRFRVSATLARVAGMTRVLPHTMSVGFLDTSSNFLEVAKHPSHTVFPHFALWKTSSFAQKPHERAIDLSSPHLALCADHSRSSSATNVKLFGGAESDHTGSV
jgi:hypothetical protein